MSYLKGRRYEYQVAQLLQREGWQVMRTAGSHGPFDLIALRGGEALGVQVKAVQRPVGMGTLWERLQGAYPWPLALRPALAVWVIGEGVRWMGR